MTGRSDNLGKESLVDTQMKAFGEYLKELRSERRISLGELADELREHGAPKHGSSRQHLGALERGEVTNPSPKLLEGLAKALNAMSTEYWLLAGHVPPGSDESKEAYTKLLQEAHRKGFERLLKDKGLTESMIDDVLSKVSDKTVDRVVRREEPLVIHRTSVDPSAVLAHKAEGFEAFAIDADITGTANTQIQESATDYMRSVEDGFTAGRRPRSHKSTARTAGKATPQREKVRAGRLAKIVVKRKLTKQERKGLEAIGSVIEHLLKK